jgi:hypothetical protein
MRAPPATNANNDATFAQQAIASSKRVGRREQGHCEIYVKAWT